MITPNKISIGDSKLGVAMMDKISCISDERRTQPIEQFDNVEYPHRFYCNEYNLLLGDCLFVLPPEFISVTSEDSSQALTAIRQENSQQAKPGHHRRTILLDLVFYGEDQINGYKTCGPETKNYYVDGLRPLLAQFKCFPFLPVTNDLLNRVYGIHVVSLISITCFIEPNFPKLMRAQLMLQETNLFPYIEVPNPLFQYMIDWDLFRYYYQNRMTEHHVYKLLQKMDLSKRPYFCMSILDPNIFLNEEYRDNTMLELITDTAVKRKNEDGSSALSNYITWVDSELDHISITQFSCSYENLISNIQMASSAEPTTQYLGGKDTMYQITFETKDEIVVRNIEQCQISNDELVRENAHYVNLGFVKLESELVAFTGSLFVSVENVVTNTIPNQPGLYQVQVQCRAYDIAQSKREQLNGFVPFKCGDSLDHPTDEIHSEQCIDQSVGGMITKALQDCYAEYQIRKTTELYPDLMLPTYQEVDDVIEKIRTFRANNQLSEYPLKRYPRSDFHVFHGNNFGNDMEEFEYLETDYVHHMIVDTSQIKDIKSYEGYVNPDFYVFYPFSYKDFATDSGKDNAYDDVCVRNQRKESQMIYSSDEQEDLQQVQDSSLNNGGVAENEHPSDNSLVEQFIELGKTYLGCSYVIGRAGEKDSSQQRTFDCSGFISYLLHSMGILSATRFSTSAMPTSIMDEIPLSEARRGDILQFSKSDYGTSYGHCAIDLGNGKILHCGGSENGKRCVNIRDKNYFSKRPWRRAYRVKAFDRKPSRVIANEGVAVMPKARLMTDEELDLIEQVVFAESGNQSYEGQCAVAQTIYDRWQSNPNKFGKQLSSVLKAYTTPKGKTSDSVKKAVKAVFMDGYRVWPTQTYYFLNPSAGADLYRQRDRYYGTRMGTIGAHTFWGNTSLKSSDVRFVLNGQVQTDTPSYNPNDIGAIIADPDISAAEKMQRIYEVGIKVFDVYMMKQFGLPILTRLDSGLTQNATTKIDDDYRKYYNNDENIFATSFVNMRQFSGHGTLLKAFPTYLFCVLDDQQQWYDGRKLWTNFYFHRSIVSIEVHSANDMPVSTAMVTINNLMHNLDRSQGGLSSYTIGNDTDYHPFSRWIYKNTGGLPFGTKITDRMISLHQKTYNHAKLREGARIHIRMGYGSDPFDLPIVFNGCVSDVNLGDQIGIVAVSDGVELTNCPISSKKKDYNKGLFGTGAFTEQEGSNIIASLMTERSNKYINWFFSNWFEASKYGIEHYGTYFHTGGMDFIENLDQKFYQERDVGYRGGVLSVIKDEFAAIWDVMTDGDAVQYDILKNIYKANYDRDHYIYYSFTNADNEKNICFDYYNKTVWDAGQICTQTIPEFILKSTYHQFDSRLYYGLPTWMEKYRYNFYQHNGGLRVFEESKASTQYHFIDSMNSIIDNQMICSSRNTFTNAKVLYTRGDSPASTSVIYSDRTIDASKQKTKIISTSICQDLLGLDWLYERASIKVGQEAARKIGVSNLLMSWESQYRGEIIILGDAGINPFDYIGLNDTYAQLFGLCTAREVIHSLNANTGFTTSITPGMIGFNTEENSNLYPMLSNYLMMTQAFASYTQARKEVNRTFKINIGAICDELFELNYSNMASKRTLYYTEMTAKNAVMAYVKVKQAVKLFSCMRNGMHFAQALNEIRTGIKALKAAKGIANISKTVTATSAAVGTAILPGVGTIIGTMAAWIACDVILDSVIEYFRNKNCIKLLPVWYKSYPYCAGITGATDLLIVGSNADATEEGAESGEVDYDVSDEDD